MWLSLLLSIARARSGLALALLGSIFACHPAPPAAASPTPRATDSARGEPRDPCAAMRESTLRLNQTLPRRLAPDTQLTAASASGCRLTLEYELSVTGAGELEGVDSTRSRLLAHACSAPGMLALLRRGGSLRSIYTDTERRPLASVTVTAHDCVSTPRDVSASLDEPH